MKTLVVNMKNYPEVFGQGAVQLAGDAAEVSRMTGVKVIVCPPHPMLALVAEKTKAEVFSQSLDLATAGMSTGAVVPEAVKAAGASGTLLNHGEARVTKPRLVEISRRARAVGLKLCICAKSAAEAGGMAQLKPEFLAVEPPELIGTGMAVSRTQPETVRETVKRLRRAGFEGSVLCGAGIVDGRDVRMAGALGADGVLVASSVVKAKNRKAKLLELAGALTA